MGGMGIIMLDNTAKISEIITALENMQGLNQKADLKSALIAKGINASESDGVANLIAKLNNANLVLNGKRSATTTLSNYTKINVGYTTIMSNLAFTPNIVIMTNCEGYVLVFTSENVNVSKITGMINGSNGWYTSGGIYKSTKIENNSVFVLFSNAKEGYMDYKYRINVIAIE